MSIPTIVIIEDDPADVFLLRACFDQLGEEYLLEVLFDGEAALRFISEHVSGVRKPEPSVVVLDFYLPRHDGSEVLAAIRQESVLKHLKVMVLTSIEFPDDRVAVERVGAICRMKPSRLSQWEDITAEIMALCKDSMGGVMSK
jgi:CheY-like chemotaxis protein